jgi:hypothetical protein
MDYIYLYINTYIYVYIDTYIYTYLELKEGSKLVPYKYVY